MGVPLETVTQQLLSQQPQPQTIPYIQQPQIQQQPIPFGQQMGQQLGQQQQPTALQDVYDVDGNPLFQEGLRGKVSGFMTVRANTLLLVAGLVAAATIGGYLERAFPRVGKYGTLVAGVLIVVMGRRNTMVKSLGMGVFLAGVAEIVRQFDFVQTHFGEPRAFEEQRTTYGGTDGMVVTTPDRRTVI